MANEQTVTELKRLSTDLRQLKAALRQKYPKPSRAVGSPSIQSEGSKIAESWLADFAQRPEIIAVVGDDVRADMAIHFQRLLTFAEHSTKRAKYDREITDILNKYTTHVVVPVMQGQGVNAAAAPLAAVGLPPPEPFTATVFVGHSFDAKDQKVAETIIGTLKAIGLVVVTGEKPVAERISEKVKKLIEANHLFVGIFTRRDRLVGKRKWNTSAWVIEEKTYASARDKKLILLRETDVDSIGGLHGDYEYIEFSRETLDDAILKLLQLFVISTSSIRLPVGAI